MSKPNVGFIGLGIMGKPMAGHILHAGYPLMVFNRTLSKTEDLAKAGAVVAESPAQLAGRCPIVITIVTDSPDVEEVIAGPQGVLAGIQPGSVVVDMSTISPEVERQLAQALENRDCLLVDAPVSGGDIGAQKGTLAIMAGGERTAFEKVKPVLETMGKSITYCGPVGSGQLTKLSNQILVAVTLLGVCEALLFARKSGLDPATMINAVAGGAAGSWQLSNLGPRIANADYAPGFMVDLIQKDLRLVMEASRSVAAPLPATSLVHQFFLAAQADGFGREGTQALATVLERLGQD